MIVYNDKNNETYLMHKQYKYIKKVWKNGKWRYFYKTSKGEWKNANTLSKLSDWAGEDDRTKAINAYNKAVNQARYNESIDQYASYKISLLNKVKGLTDSKYRERQDKLLNNRLSQKTKRDERLGTLKQEANYLLTKYSGTPIGAIETTLGKTINVGKDFITKRVAMDNRYEKKK